MDFLDNTTLEIIFYFICQTHSLTLNKCYGYKDDNTDIKLQLAEVGQEMYDLKTNLYLCGLLNLFKLEENYDISHKCYLIVSLKNVSEGRKKLVEFMQKEVEFFKNGEMTSTKYYSFKRHLYVMDKVLKDYRNEYGSDRFTINSEFSASVNPVKDVTIDFNKIRIIEMLFYLYKEGLIAINDCIEAKSKLDPLVKPFSLDINITLSEQFISQNVNEVQEEDNLVNIKSEDSKQQKRELKEEPNNDKINIIKEGCGFIVYKDGYICYKGENKFIGMPQAHILAFAIGRNTEEVHIKNFVDYLHSIKVSKASEKTIKNQYFSEVNNAIYELTGMDMNVIKRTKDPDTEKCSDVLYKIEFLSEK